MKCPSKLTAALAGLCIAAASYLVFRGGSPAAPAVAAVHPLPETKGKSPRQRDSIAAGDSLAGPTESEVAGMTPADWEALFESRYQGLDGELRQRIVMLSGDLQEMLGNGAQPDGEEPRVFVQAIMVLLNEKPSLER